MTMESFKFRRTGDEDYPRHIKALVLGPPKSGKTTFVSTFPNIVVADVEAGLMSIAHLDIPYVTIDSSNKLQTLLFVLKDDTLRQKAAEQLGMEKIESVGLDTLDALQDLMKRERLASERRTLFEQADWGWLLGQFREILRAFVALPLHVALTVHTKTTQDEDNRIITMPGLQGSIAEEIAGYVGFSVLMNRSREVDPQTSRPYTKYSLKVEGDDRNPHLGNRAAGRLSESIDPEFKHLHTAVYPPDLKLRPRVTAAEISAEGVAAAVAAGAQQEVAQPVATPPPTPNEQVEEAQTINESAIQHLKAIFTEWGFTLPDDVRSWTLGFGRTIARMFVAVKAEIAAGQRSQEDGKTALVDYLKGVNAWLDPEQAIPEGKIEEVIAWVGDNPERAQRALAHEKANKDRITLKQALDGVLRAALESAYADQEEAPKPPPKPQPAPTPPEASESKDQDGENKEAAPAPTDSKPSEESPAEAVTPPPAPVDNVDNTEAEAEAEVDHSQAIENLQAGLGAKAIELSKADLMRLTDLSEAPPCQETGKPVDDLDIAQLSLTRYDKWLCVEAYLKHMKEVKSGG